MNIKQIRDKLLLTQEELARELGVHINTIVGWESKRCTPSIKHKRKIKQYCEEHNIQID